MAMVEHTIWYFVSEDPDQLIRPAETELGSEIQHYRTEADAIAAIKLGRHGEYGSLYVIKADLSVTATATRGWTLVSGLPPRELQDPFSDNGPDVDPPGPTDPF